MCCVLHCSRIDPGVARLLTEQLAHAAAAAELPIGADNVADAFIETRLGGQWAFDLWRSDARHNAERIHRAFIRRRNRRMPTA